MTPLQSFDDHSQTPQALSGVSRRDFLIRGSTLLAALALSDSPLYAEMWRISEGEKVVPFLDQAPTPPDAAIRQYGDLNTRNWEQLSSWATPNEDFFTVSHYNRPVLKAEEWRLNIEGLVERPISLTLEQIRAAAAGGHVYAGVRRQSRLRLVHRRHRECEMGRNAARSNFTGGRHQEGRD
jgi:hypothetical protein